MNTKTLKYIPGYEGLYSATNEGHIYSHPSKKFLKQTINKNGYAYVSISKNGVARGFRVHRLIICAFVGNSNLHVNHINGIKTDNRIENLEYCTASENQKHRYNVLLKKGSENQKNAVANTGKNNSIPIIQFSRQGNKIKEWISATEAARQLNISQPNISACCKGKDKTYKGYIWKYNPKETINERQKARFSISQ